MRYNGTLMDYMKERMAYLSKAAKIYSEGAAALPESEERLCHEASGFIYNKNDPANPDKLNGFVKTDNAGCKYSTDYVHGPVYQSPNHISTSHHRLHEMLCDVIHDRRVQRLLWQVMNRVHVTQVANMET